MQTFHPTWFDDFMMGTTQFLIPFWFPVIVASLVAIGGKALLKILPVPEGPKNLLMSVAGNVRTVAILMVLFFFWVLFWYFTRYLPLQAQFIQEHYGAPAQQTP